MSGLLGEQDAAELRGMLASRGWEVAVQVLEDRLVYVKRALLVDQATRPVGMTDPRLRAEAMVLQLLLNKPLELLQAYDRITAETLSPEYTDWVNRALESGMGYAGFPQPPANPADERL